MMLAKMLSSKQINENTLLKKIINGNYKAFTNLYHAHASEVANYAAKFTKDIQIIANRIHDIFVWVSSFLNGSEAWANFRRSGFPALAPNPYPSADPAVKGGFIHRLVYPVRERSVNTANYNEA